MLLRLAMRRRIVAVDRLLPIANTYSANFLPLMDKGSS